MAEDNRPYSLIVVVPRASNKPGTPDESEYDYYNVSSDTIKEHGVVIPDPDPRYKELVTMEVHMAHIPKSEIPGFCGTYLVNLASFHRSPSKEPVSKEGCSASSPKEQPEK